ncbi:MAG: glycosyltransferase family 2 protein, partial [Kiritimatiellia bacterium]|nr:glycosyltransferase family 2 protein [Kiritimatiellia bacterium]
MTAVDTVRGEPGPEKMARIGHGCPVDVAHRPGRPPRVSVIVPTYNRAQMVCACVDSVLKSDWPDFEVIVADDCSPDDTRRMVEERYRSDERVKYTRTERNSLTSGARNQGARCATGDYYFF